MIPFLELAKGLSTRNFNICLCSTRVNLDSFKLSIEKDYSSIQLVELDIPSTPELPPEMHTTKNLPPDRLLALTTAFQMSSSSFSDIMNSVKPDLLIYDLYQPWASKLASSKNIPSVFFSVSGATSYAYYHHVYTMGTGSPFPHEAIHLPDHKWIEMVKFITPYIKDADAEDFAFGIFTLSSDIVLTSGSREVEHKYIDYLSVLSKKRIVSTGPLIAHATDDDDDDKEHSEVMTWLSGKKRGSTIYISFGSENYLSDEQIGEIAKGLQLSNANFVWVIRSPLGEMTMADVEEKLPVQFLETVKERGLIIPGWAPQGKILGHPSIGGFVSHCGWNGAMQSMYFGVPVIAMPMQFDQPLIARQVVEAGTGVEVERGKNGIFLGEELAKAINKVTLEESCLRDRAKTLSQRIKENSETETNDAAEQLLKICLKHKKQQVY
ncbi:beta-d-glucosyl crocetin beta-1 6-glucosyltransferase [Phtheirospermum japonicum]|uniref:Glycosyltransferase n=1 Tax=Phtheirospermum japonicum TaxID=374723 RepID=A0A830BD73_9LAMI|nr:beta-d-glucosyl crocetin beta-1 6-glucosyltransferase [Phtheirospermum japonicum]